MKLKLLIGCIAVLCLHPTIAQNTTKTFSMETAEGTWISLDISPDGQTISFDLMGHLYTMPVAGGDVNQLTDGKTWNSFPRYSPDGQQILYTSDQSGSEDLWVMNAKGTEQKNLTNMDLPVFQGTWSKDGRHVYGTGLSMFVRFPVYQFNMFGKKQEMIPAGGREPINHLTPHPTQDLLYMEHNTRGGIYTRGGPQIKTYNLKTGEMKPYTTKVGGAASPILSPDGKYLAYVNRDKKETVLVLHNLETRKEEIIYRGLDWGRFEQGGFYGCYSNMDWHPNGKEIFVSFGGEIQAIDVKTKSVRNIPFTVNINRELDATQRVKQDFPSDGKTETRVHRWGIQTTDGIVHEALGDLHLTSKGKTSNLTNSSDHETNPVYDEKSNTVFYAGWNDESLGSIWSLDLKTKKSTQLTTKPSQYGSIAYHNETGMLAFIRGAGGLPDGQRLESQTAYALVIRTANGQEQVINDISWIGNRYAKCPPTTKFSKDGKRLFFTEYEDGELTLKSIRTDGMDEQTLYIFLRATRAIISPNEEWVAFREYHRTYVTPFEFSGKVQKVSAHTNKGYTQRVDVEDGDFTEWNSTSDGLYWTRGNQFFEKSLADILGDEQTAKKTALTIPFTVEKLATQILLQNVRVITMNEADEVLEGVNVLIEENRITQIGADVSAPNGAKTYDLAGHTNMPGMFDAHGHYGSPISALNVIEQKPYGLHANLAYGVTTMYDVYGTTQKDFWLDDMIRSGKVTGPRIFSVGDPVFVTTYRSKMYRPIKSYEDALEIARFNKAYGATALKDYSNHNGQARQWLIQACKAEELNLITESFGNPQMNFTQIIDGFTGIEHTPGLTPLYEDAIGLFEASDVGMTPTLIVVYNGPSGENYFYQNERIWEDEKLLNFFRQDELLRKKRPTHYFEDDFYHMDMAREMHKLHKRGVLLQMGAHGQMMGIGAHWEMEMFVHGGFSPLEAIRVATINGFKHQGLDEELGFIETGKLADLIIMEKNPLENIRNSRTIKYVMKNGVVYSGGDASRVYPEPKEAGKIYFQDE